MDDLSIEEIKAQIENLQALMEQRKQETKRETKPKPLSTPDFSDVAKLCQDYIDDLDNEGYADEGYDHWMFETAMVAVFGPDVWEWTNPIKRGD